MKPLITESGKKFILVTVILGVVALFFIHTQGPAAQQLRNMEKARLYAEAITPEIAMYPEFQFVELSAYTGLNGSLYVGGILRNQEAEKELKKFIYTADLPTEVKWAVRVDLELWEAYASEELSPKLD